MRGKVFGKGRTRSSRSGHVADLGCPVSEGEAGQPSSSLMLADIATAHKQHVITGVFAQPERPLAVEYAWLVDG